MLIRNLGTDRAGIGYRSKKKKKDLVVPVDITLVKVTGRTVLAPSPVNQQLPSPRKVVKLGYGSICDVWDDQLQWDYRALSYLWAQGMNDSVIT